LIISIETTLGLFIFFLYKKKSIRIVENVREVYMPVIWFGVSADLSDHLLGLIHFTLIGPYIGSFCFFLLFGGCMVLVAKSGIKYAKMNRKQPKTEATAEEDKSERNDTESIERENDQIQ
jgi:scavenger receptor class B protein 1